MNRIEIPWVELNSHKMRDKNRFLSYKDAKTFVHSLNIKSQIEWRKYCKSGNKPNNIPSSPHFVYKNKGWVGYYDWLGK